MTPIDRIREFYQLHPQEQPFEWYLNWHLADGFVFSTPEFFIMGRPIKMYPDEEATIHGIDNFAIWDRSEHNCWYVHAMSGNIAKCWDILPYPLGFIAFERTRNGKRELTIMPTERIRRLTHDFFEQQLASA